MLVWANCHGGFVLGWMVLCAWCAEAIYLRLKGLPAVGDFRLYAVSAVSILVSGINPNGFRVLEVLANYQQSLMTATLAEWRPPLLWPPTPFSVLLAAAAVALAVARRRVRPADWLLFTAFAVAGLSAGRNTFLIALLAPILIAAYVPWKRTLHAYAQVGVALLLAGGFAVEIAEGRSFQLRAAEWQFPAGAADFLLAHHITQPIFNTYEYGGYLIWRLWPQERVFIDGRALSESLFQDYVRILAYSGNSDVPGAEQLLDRYGVRAVVMNGFDYAGGQRYPLALGLVNLEDSPWRLVYADPQALVYLRDPPQDVPALDPMQVPAVLESQCRLHLEREPQFPGCARDLGQMFSALGDFTKARSWLGIYLETAGGISDTEAREAYRRMVEAGR